MISCCGKNIDIVDYSKDEYYHCIKKVIDYNIFIHTKNEIEIDKTLLMLE